MPYAPLSLPSSERRLRDSRSSESAEPTRPIPIRYGPCAPCVACQARRVQRRHVGGPVACQSAQITLVGQARRSRLAVAPSAICGRSSGDRNGRLRASRCSSSALDAESFGATQRSGQWRSDFNQRSWPCSTRLRRARTTAPVRQRRGWLATPYRSPTRGSAAIRHQAPISRPRSGRLAQPVAAQGGHGPWSALAKEAGLPPLGPLARHKPPSVRATRHATARDRFPRRLNGTLRRGRTRPHRPSPR